MSEEMLPPPPESIVINDIDKLEPDKSAKRFRGVFDSLDQVENPEIGDVVHTVIKDENGNRTDKVLVYIYSDTDHWVLTNTTDNISSDVETGNKPISIINDLNKKEKEQAEFEKIQKERKKITDTYKQIYIHKYDLEKVNFEEELEKIKRKESGLSRRQRDAVVAYFAIFKEDFNKEKQPVETDRKPIVPNNGSKPTDTNNEG